MEPAEAVFLTLQAKYKGDTASGGLRDKGKAFVPLFIDPDDLNKDPGPGVVRVNTNAISDDSPQGATSFSGIVTFEVFTSIDSGRAKQRAIVDRLRTLFHNTELTVQGGWNFQPARWLSQPLGQRDGKSSVRNCRVFISGSKA